MKHHRPIILTVGAFMAVSALTFSTPARSDVGRVLAPAAPAAPTVPGCPDAEGYTTGATVDELRPLYVGVWIQCSDTSLPGDVLDGALGFEFAANGWWSLIHRAPDGGLLRGRGIGQEGTWTLFASTTGAEVTTEHLQLNLTDLIGGLLPMPSTLTASPEVLLLNNGMSADLAGFQHWTGAPPTGDAPPAQPFPGCPAASGPRTLRAASEAMEALAGTWIRCSSDSPFPPHWNEGEVGVQLASTGEWHVLVLDDKGMPVPSTSPVQSGRYSVYMHGTGFQISFTAADHTGLSVVGASLSQPAFLYLFDTMSGIKAGFVPWDGKPLPIVPPSL